MKQNNEKDVIRKHLMKECRECYDILAEDEKKAIIWDKELTEYGVSYLVDKKHKVVEVLIPLYYDIVFDGNKVTVQDRLHDMIVQGKFTLEFISNGMWWREDGNQVVEIAEDTTDPIEQKLYHDFFNK